MKSFFQAFFLFLIFIETSIAQDTPVVTQKTESDSLALSLLVDQSNVSGNVSSSSYSGIGVGTLVVKGLSRRFGIGGGVRASFASLGAQSSIMAFSFHGIYAPLGSLVRERSETLVDGSVLGQVTDKYPSTLRLHVLFNQYFLNGTRNTVPYSGIGGIIDYTHGFSTLWGLTVGARLDQLVNGSNSLNSTSFFGGMSFLL